MKQTPLILSNNLFINSKPLRRIQNAVISLGSYQSVCWSSMTRRILALLEPIPLSVASLKVAAAAAVVCLTALEMEEKKPAPVDWLGG